MRQHPASFRKFFGDRRGVAAIEFALIAPVMVLLYFGIVDLANWYMTHRKLVVAASTIADLVTQSPGKVEAGEIDDYWDSVNLIIEPLSISSVPMTLRNYRLNGGSPQEVWSHPGPAGSCGAAPSTEQLEALAANGMEDGNDILVASVCATIAPIVLKPIDYPPIDMEYQISMRPRLGKTLDCPSC